MNGTDTIEKLGDAAEVTAEQKHGDVKVGPTGHRARRKERRRLERRKARSNTLRSPGGDVRDLYAKLRAHRAANPGFRNIIDENGDLA